VFLAFTVLPLPITMIELLVHDPHGQIQTVQYQKLDAMLLNEIQKLRRLNEKLESRITDVRCTAAAGLLTSGS
jgi:hypothetical protein